MRKGIKTLISVAVAATITAGALSLSACDSGFQTPVGIPEGEVVSNGGFAVEKGEYIYFINGYESYEADNTYGTPVKGSLQRIRKADADQKKNTAETVIPSLMVTGDYNAGIYIFGDRVYYTTTNDVKDPSTGEVSSDYVVFCSAKLDGTDIKTYFRLEDSGHNKTYRIAEDGGKVYILYSDNSELRSYNTETETETVLVKHLSTSSFTMETATTYDGLQNGVANTWVYYTLGVTEAADTEGGEHSFDYNQIYRVRVSATEAAYTYQWNQEFVDNELGGEPPYWNYGEIVLDGRGEADTVTQFNPEKETKPLSPFGYTYVLNRYTNGGIYFTRSELAGTGSVGEDGELYYLPETAIGAEDWDSVGGNKDETEGGALEVVASPQNTSKTTSAIFYIDGEGQHHYLYSLNSHLYRADVKTDGSGDNELEGDLKIVHSASGAQLSFIDNTSDGTYQYLYYTMTNGNGRSVERVVYNGAEGNYANLQFGSESNKPYESVRVLNIQHNSSWYPYEIIDGTLFFADADSTVNARSYNYIACLSLKKDGKLMSNPELDALNEKYNAIMSSDAKTGLLAKLNSSDYNSSKLSTAIKYYFYTGETAAFDGNISEAQEQGESLTYLYSEAEQAAFKAFAEGKGYTDENTGNVFFGENDYLDEENVSYRTLSYFYTHIGKMTDEDVEAQSEYWRTALERYVFPPEAEEEGLADWAIALIVLASLSVLVSVVLLAAGLRERSKRRKAEPAPERMHVDTTDDRDVDVYATDDGSELPAEEPTEEPAEGTAEEVEEPAEEAAEEPTEEPAAEEPQETPSDDGDPYRE